MTSDLHDETRERLPDPDETGMFLALHLGILNQALDEALQTPGGPEPAAGTPATVHPPVAVAGPQDVAGGVGMQDRTTASAPIPPVTPSNPVPGGVGTRKDTPSGAIHSVSPGTGFPPSDGGPAVPTPPAPSGHQAAGGREAETSASHRARSADPSGHHYGTTVLPAPTVPAYGRTDPSPRWTGLSAADGPHLEWAGAVGQDPTAGEGGGGARGRPTLVGPAGVEPGVPSPSHPLVEFLWALLGILLGVALGFGAFLLLATAALYILRK